jgi:hypothetical protein
LNFRVPHAFVPSGKAAGFDVAFRPIPVVFARIAQIRAIIYVTQYARGVKCLPRRESLLWYADIPVKFRRGNRS